MLKTNYPETSSGSRVATVRFLPGRLDEEAIYRLSAVSWCLDGHDAKMDSDKLLDENIFYQLMGSSFHLVKSLCIASGPETFLPVKETVVDVFPSTPVRIAKIKIFLFLINIS